MLESLHVFGRKHFKQVKKLKLYFNVSKRNDLNQCSIGNAIVWMLYVNINKKKSIFKYNDHFPLQNK